MRIPRPEVEEIEQTVQDHVHTMVPGARVQACGSYRRGKTSSGDVDILICHPGGECDVLLSLIERLHKKGLLTHDLSLPDSHTSGGACEGLRGCEGCVFEGVRVCEGGMRVCV